MRRLFIFGGLFLICACGSAAPRPLGPSVFATCRTWPLAGEPGSVFRATCGDLYIMARQDDELWRQDVDGAVFPSVIQASRDLDGFRTTPIRVAIAGQYRNALDLFNLVDGSSLYSRVAVIPEPNTGRTLQLWCTQYNRPLGQDCDAAMNQLGTITNFSELHASIPVDPESIERERRRSLASCTPSQRIDTSGYGTLERVTQLACDERTLFVGEEAGALNDESRQMAFDRFRETFGAINSWNATFDLNGVEHPGVRAERSESDGTRTEGFVMLLPSTRDRHRIFVCITPGDVSTCSPLLTQLATLPGVAGLLGPTQEATAPAASAPDAQAQSPTESDAPAERRRRRR